MSDDEFGDDIADEDLMLAYEAVSSTAFPAPAPPTVPPIFARPQNVATTPKRPPASRARSSSAKKRQRLPPRPPPPSRAANASRNQPPTPTINLAAELEGLPSDAFDSSQINGGHSQRSLIASCRQPLHLSGQSSFRQTTLHGEMLQEEPSQAPSSSRIYRGDLPPEVPTHHKLVQDELKTWVYPTNLGPIRDYQFNIVKNGLFHNTLVALPTGLGKTFIAATVILNFYRWTTDAKMVFVAPTKPLVSQQVDACLNVAGIPRSATTLLTGDTPPGMRAEEWASKRLFFMTPQTLQNDLSKGYADPKSIVLLVIDEAHRATGDYAYVKVIGFIRRFTKSFRVLALTATPGSTVEGVQDVIDNLGVSHVEIRTEESIDIRSYVHNRDIERFVLDPSMEIRYVQEHLSKALQPFCDKLGQQKIWYGRDPMSLSTFSLLKARRDWMAGPGRNVNQGTKFMIMAVFALLQSVAHSIKLLNFHGIKPFYDSIAEFRSDAEKDEKGSKYRKQLVRDENFQEMMMTIERWLREDSFESHPKIAFLKERLNTHFQDNPPGSNTRAIVFSEYRDSAEEIVRTLNRCGSRMKASIFVGQADSKRSSGMKQKQQIEAIERFKSGEFNILVATSIGEEGLDIGQVDLIICYDASSSPIRMLQRMGRTGRKRAGHVILLLMRGKEEEKFADAQNNYAYMQKMICDGSHFNFRFDMSERILPRDAKPEVEKRHVEIPIENTQNTALPEPKRSQARAKKAPKKKFHMPDNVETGFVTASSVLDGPKKRPNLFKTSSGPDETAFLADIPDLATAVAKCSGSNVGPYDIHVDTAYFEFMQNLRPTKRLGHGQYTRRSIRIIGRLASERYARPTENAKNYKKIPVPAFARDPNASEELDVSDSSDSKDRKMTSFFEPLPKKRRVFAPPKMTQRQRVISYGPLNDAVKDEEDEEDEEEERPRKRSFKPAVKGLTKQRSSQWQSYNFSASSSRPPPPPSRVAVQRKKHIFSDLDDDDDDDVEEVQRDKRVEQNDGEKREEQDLREEQEERERQEREEREERMKREKEAREWQEARKKEEQKKQEERKMQERKKQAERKEREEREERERQKEEMIYDSELDDMEEPEEEEEEEEEEENDEVVIIQLPPTTSWRSRGRGRGGARGGRGGRGGRGRGGAVSYGRLEEQGDDCMRTSDNYESDGSDSGGDLVDFIADDDEEVEQATSSLRTFEEEEDDDDDDDDDRRGRGRGGGRGRLAKRRAKVFSSSMTSNSSPPQVMHIDADKAKEASEAAGKQFYVPIRLSQALDSDDMDDDDDDMGNFGRKDKPKQPKQPKRLPSSLDDDDSSRVFARRPAKAARGRRLMDSDSDE